MSHDDIVREFVYMKLCYKITYSYTVIKIESIRIQFKTATKQTVNFKIH